jgi:hypothetical protein
MRKFAPKKKPSNSIRSKEDESVKKKYYGSIFKKRKKELIN